MKKIASPQLLVIQKVSSVITRERDVEALLGVGGGKEADA